VRTRFAGMTAAEVQDALRSLGKTRDVVLANARVAENETLADVGAGTGLLTLGAVGRVGPDGDVLAIDISADALAELRRLCAAPNVAYLIGAADVLPLLDESVDAVVTRSVLIYVRDKQEAAREFFRVLRSGGRCALFEPLNVRNQRLTDLIDFGDLAVRVREWEHARRAETDDPMLDFDEQDLVEMFRDSGFRNIRSELRVTEQEIRPEPLLTAVGAPGRRSLAEEWAEIFRPEELERLRRSIFDHGTLRAAWTGMYLAAEKP
jgi:arsenite methyltransferase